MKYESTKFDSIFHLAANDTTNSLVVLMIKK